MLPPLAHSLTLWLASADYLPPSADASLHRLSPLPPHTLPHTLLAGNRSSPTYAPSPLLLSPLPASPSSFYNMLPTHCHLLARSLPLGETPAPPGCCSLSFGSSTPSLRSLGGSGSGLTNSKNASLSETSLTLPPPPTAAS